MSQFILAIDQGTTGTTALLTDQNLNVVAKTNCEFRQVYPKPGWVEHQDLDIWNSIRESVNGCISEAGIKKSEIYAIGITNQRETTCLFDKNSRALHNFIVWQCKRSQKLCESLQQAGHLDLVKQKTGLLLDPYFSGSKLKWLFENHPALLNQAKAGTLKFGTIDSWLLHRLSDGAAHKTDVTNASRTLLMDIKTLKWDDDLLEIFGVPKRILPEIVSNAEIMGKTRGLDFLPDGIPISGMAGDQQSALIGQACFEKGDTKATYGTGSFILMNTGPEAIQSSKGLLTTVAFKIGNDTKYCLEGSAFVAGAAVQWLRDNLGIIKSSEEIEGLARTVSETGDLSFVPALSGLGTPYWKPEARGLIRGISRDTNRGHLARAALEGIALQNMDIMRAMQSDAGEMSVIKVDGGASRNNLLMQYQADVLDLTCKRPQVTETTALGAATLAGLGIGLFESIHAASKAWKLDRQFVPEMTNSERQRHLDKWGQAVASA